MTLLAIETATTVCAAAVVRDGAVIAEASRNEKYIHAETLMVQIDAVLRDAGAAPQSLDAIAVSIGPGSFTGLRIGLSVAKGLAFALDKKLVAVPTLHALASGSLAAVRLQPADCLLAALNARREEVYAEYFKIEEGNVISCEGVHDMSLQTLLDNAPGERIVVTGDAQATIRAFVPPSDGRWEFVPEAAALCTAGSVGLVGESMYARNECADVATLEPMYIKEFLFRQNN
jgi:tRNA threonylcarbamoyladenosine biosynthesis protein TsaB